jgi:3-oxoacyl-[acyl-carrier protein] reductase
MIRIDLKGKTALVTGSSRGIGKDISVKLAEAGCNIAINYYKSSEKALDVSEQIKSLGKKSIIIKADIKQYKQVQEMISQVASELGTIDILINNTGITSVKNVEELDDIEWHRILETNLTGAYYCCREVAPIMKKKRSGRIVNISSSAAYTGRGGGAHYAATKGGMNGMTRALAREFAPFGILVNGIAPAVIETDFIYTRYPTRKQRDELANGVPIGRIGTGEDIANIAVFLCSHMSDYISGETILADGGRTFTGS